MDKVRNPSNSECHAHRENPIESTDLESIRKMILHDDLKSKRLWPSLRYYTTIYVEGLRNITTPQLMASSLRAKIRSSGLTNTRHAY
jgi:hypothetical protein